MEKDNSSEIFDQELHEHFAFNIDVGQEPIRIDKFLMNRIENATRNKIQKAAKEGSIRVNDIIVKSSYKVKKGDKIRILFTHPPYENLLTPENIDLDIKYEDDSIIIINKKSGIVVHPGHGNYSGTLINGLLYHFDNLPNNSSNRPGLVHRIDKDTSGLLVIAKTEKSMTNLAKQFFKKSVEREYLALVWGDLKNDEGEINAPIGRNPKNRLQMIVYEDLEGGKEAITNYKVIERFGYVTLVSCKLKTGRTHQIRVHMKYIGHTLFNDERYGGNKILKGTVYSKYKQFVENCFHMLPRQALHARTLGFSHPKTKENIMFDSEIPDDMNSVIEKWRYYSKHKNL
ncbi:MAG: RluA family pseudouridine synthase [Bacteroidetes bacterium]|nr:RluA family pseudouridine synthase [Cryomorphaceae bacterium]MBL6677212.1 RluA family pseudouridine synthase [Flavobacteriaceae bacterium]MDA0884999.1 RluA family pseudouridine synthase [Bacteroidota bacterium]